MLFRNWLNCFCGMFEGKRGSIWREKVWKFVFLFFFNYLVIFYYEGSSKCWFVFFDRCVVSELWIIRKCF